VRIGNLRVSPAASPVYEPERKVNAMFGKEIALIGFDRSVDSLTLYWRAAKLSQADYTVFVHLLDAEGKMIAQTDGPPTRGRYPTSAWLLSEVVKDEHPIHWPAQVAQVRVGLYQAQTGVRLPATKPDGNRYADDAVELPNIIDR
jgi:hypothetical protein